MVRKTLEPHMWNLENLFKSIRIYPYVAKVGETETLREKRLAYVQEHNEAVK